MIILFFIAAILVVAYFGYDIEAMFGPIGIKIAFGIVAVLTVALYIIKDISKSGGGIGHHSSGNYSGGGYSVDELEEMDMMDEDK